MTQLTDHFSLEEMTRSDYAERHGIDNKPNLEIIANLTEMAMVMERVRMAVGAPISVTSGYRCGKLNTAIGGSKTSAHVRGHACDFVAFGQTARETALKIAPLVKELGIDQLIFEFGRWVHIGLAEYPRHQVLTAKFEGSHVSYMQGVM